MSLQTRFVARPSIFRLILLLAGCVAFVALGIWIAGLVGTAPKPGREWAGWAAILFFGFCGLNALRRLFDRDDQIIVDGSGLYWKQWSNAVIPWSEMIDVREIEAPSAVPCHLFARSRAISNQQRGRPADPPERGMGIRRRHDQSDWHRQELCRVEGRDSRLLEAAARAERLAGMASPSRFSPRQRVRSFGYAWDGLRHLVASEHNGWIHAAVTVLVIAASIYLHLRAEEWRRIILAIAFVWVAEALNTAIEQLADAVTLEPNQNIGFAKDVAAGAVLLAALFAVVVGTTIFLPYIFMAFAMIFTI